MLRVAGQKTTRNQIDLIAEEDKFCYKKGDIVHRTKILSWLAMKTPQTIMISVNKKGKKEIILMC